VHVTSTMDIPTRDASVSRLGSVAILATAYATMIAWKGCGA